ncbi:MFS general substrate transporter [Serendipita vermifera]|nr:MFS general substrate transporter [Serendipita vermifera]
MSSNPFFQEKREGKDVEMRNYNYPDYLSYPNYPGVAIVPATPPEPPKKEVEGEWRGWLTVLGAWCNVFATFGMISSFGVFQDFYARVYLTNYTPSQIGWIGSFQVFLMFFCGIPAGILFDAGYFWPMITSAAFIYNLSHFLLSTVPPQNLGRIFAAQGFGAGLGLGFSFLPAMSLTARHFNKKRAWAMGIAVSGSSIGGMVFPVMLNKLIVKHGFAYAVRAAAGLTTAMMAISLLLMRMPKNLAKPEGPKPSIAEFFKDIKYALALLGVFIGAFGIFFPLFYIQLYAALHHVNLDLAFYTVTILNGASTFGRLVPNLLADSYGSMNLWVLACAASALLIFCMFAITAASAIIVFCILYGFFSGAVFSLVGPLFASMARNPQEVGARMGLGYGLMAFSFLGTSPISGALLTDEYHWNRAIIFAGVMVAAGSGPLLISRMWVAREKGTWRV